MEAVKAIRDYRPPTKLPQSAQLAWKLYDNGPSKGLSEQDVDKLRGYLASFDDDQLKELTDELCGLAVFQTYVGEHLGDEEAATKVAGLVREVGPRYVPFFKRALAKANELGDQTRKLFARFFDRDLGGEKRAPMQDAKQPEGTVSLKSLKPPAQIPHWAKKSKPR